MLKCSGRATNESALAAEHSPGHCPLPASKGILEKTNLVTDPGNTSYSWEGFIFYSFSVLPVLVVH